MHVLSPEATAAALPYAELADGLRNVLRDLRHGTAHAPARLAAPLAAGGTLLLMPAVDRRLAVTKLVTVHPCNAEHGMAVVQAELVVMEAETGRRLCVLDGATVTARRTAALSLLAAQALAPNLTGALLIVGAGAFVAAIGAYRPDMAELPRALVRRGQIYVDTLPGARHEAGDLIQADIDWSGVVAIESIVDDERETGIRGPVLFKSVGHALWDLAAARVAIERLTP